MADGFFIRFNATVECSDGGSAATVVREAIQQSKCDVCECFSLALTGVCMRLFRLHFVCRWLGRVDVYGNGACVCVRVFSTAESQ